MKYYQKINMDENFKYILTYNNFIEHVESKPFTNIDAYIEDISKPLLDKLFFMEKIRFDCIVDYGCADGSVLEKIRSMRPEVKLIGYDNNPEMIKRAKSKLNDPNIVLTTNWNEVISIVSKYKMPILNLSSVIHEIYSYSHGKFVKEFWQKQVFGGKFKYITIRDMIPSVEIYKVEEVENDIEHIKSKTDPYYINTFEKRWGNIDDYRTMIHFLLKYKFTDNWEREVNENYIPLTLETLKKKIPNNYTIIFQENFILPYLKEQVKKDFNIDINHSTHTKIIIENKRFR